MSSEFHLPAEPPLNILVVEDSIPFAKLIISRLERGLDMPHKIQHVDRTDNGVQALRETEFDLIILDMHLPDTSGLATFKAIYRVASEVPIVILSSASHHKSHRVTTVFGHDYQPQVFTIFATSRHWRDSRVIAPSIGKTNETIAPAAVDSRLISPWCDWARRIIA